MAIAPKEIPMSNLKFTFDEFEPVCRALSEMWPIMAKNHPLTEFALKIFYQALCEWELYQVENALAEYIKSDKGDFRPAPAGIIAHLPKAKAEISPIERAKVVWSQVMIDIGSHGSTRDKETICPVALELVKRFGGWRWLSGKTESELTWIGKDFVDNYQPKLKIAQAEKVRERLALQSTGQAAIAKPVAALGDLNANS